MSTRLVKTIWQTIQLAGYTSQSGMSVPRPPGKGTRCHWQGAGLCQCTVCAAQDSPVGRRPRTSGVCARSRGKGSHRKFRHQKFPGALILSGHDGDDARHYPEKQVRNAIRAASK